jgi:hypothetical protein
VSKVLFTPVSARRALRTLKPELERLCGLYRELERGRPAEVRADGPVDRRYLRKLLAFRERLGAIERHGVSVSDPRLGRIEFPARRGGRSIRLRWQLAPEEETPALTPDEESGWDEL